WLAYVRKVDKIVGPGNAHVNAAKLEVSRDVAIDLPGGPSEVVVVADADADPRVVELELAAQAEHGSDTVCKVVSTLEEAEGLERIRPTVEALAASEGMPAHIAAVRRG